MIWVATLLFTALGIWLIVRRREVARGQGLALGATMPAGCVLAQGVVFLLLAGTFVVLHKVGLL